MSRATEEEKDALCQKILKYDDKTFELHKKFLAIYNKLQYRNPVAHPMVLHNLGRLYWDDATEEQKNDPSLEWKSTGFGDSLKHGTDKYTFRPLTEQEQELKRQYYTWQFYTMFNTILTQEGWETAEAFTKHPFYVKDFKKFGITFNGKYPHCEFDKGNQCDLTCPYFIKKCTYFDSNAEALPYSSMRRGPAQ